MAGRAFVGKSLEVVGLVLGGMALLIGLKDNDMNRELLTLMLAAAVFVAGWLLERGRA